MTERGVGTGYAEISGTSGADSPRCRAMPQGTADCAALSCLSCRDKGGRKCAVWPSPVDKSGSIAGAVAVVGVASVGALRHSASVCRGLFLGFGIFLLVFCPSCDRLMKKSTIRCCTPVGRRFDGGCCPRHQAPPAIGGAGALACRARATGDSFFPAEPAPVHDSPTYAPPLDD